MSNRWVKWGIAGVALGAAAAYGVVWAKRYREIMLEKHIEAEIMGMVPEDVIPGSEIDLGEVAEFDGIVTHSCFDSCCYKPLSATEADAYGYDGAGGYMDFPDEY